MRLLPQAKLAHPPNFKVLPPHHPQSLTFNTEMMFKASLALALVPFALASPQLYGPPPPPDTTTSSTPAPTSTSFSSSQVIVQVGANGGFAFTPSDIKASNGTLVTFVFGANIAHSVTESTFSDPCTPIGTTQSGVTGFDSGLVTGPGQTFSVNVTNDQTPVYFFCKFPAHCGLGMVGTINAPSSGNGSNSAYTSAAMAIGGSEKTIPDNGPQTGGVGAIATAGPTSGTPSVSGAAPTNTGSGGSGSTSGASPLAVSGGLLSLVAAVFAFVL